jgi:hypothetical protein
MWVRGLKLFKSGFLLKERKEFSRARPSPSGFPLVYQVFKVMLLCYHSHILL